VLNLSSADQIIIFDVGYSDVMFLMSAVAPCHAENTQVQQCFFGVIVLDRISLLPKQDPLGLLVEAIYVLRFETSPGLFSGIAVISERPC